MKFEKLTPPVTGTVRTVKLSARALKNGSMSIYLSIPREFIKGDDLCFELSYGVQERTGILRLRPAGDEGFKGRLMAHRGDRSKSGSVVFRLGETPFAPDSDQKSTACKFERDGEVMLITLPAWCFTDFGEEPGNEAGTGGAA